MNFLAAVPERAWDLVANWGPAIVVLAGLYLIARRVLASLGAVADTALREFLSSQRAQAEAITKLAVCFEGQAHESNQMGERILSAVQVVQRDMRSLEGKINRRENENV